MTPGLSGSLARAFIRSPLTPLILLVSLALGGLALVVMPREEEPQISVPMVDIHVTADGLKATDVVELVTEPLEDIVKGVEEVEHVYSLSEDDRVVVTARFDVGTDEDTAIVRVNDAIQSNLDRIPIGIPEPLVVGRGIDDVPVVTLTLHPESPQARRWDDNALYGIAEELLHELVKVDDVGRAFIVGGRADQVRIEPDPERLSLYGVTLAQLVAKVRHANRSFVVGELREAGRAVPVLAGQTLFGVPDVGLLLITSRDGRPVYVGDVADIVVGPEPAESRAWHIEKAADGALTREPAVTLALAKRKGANAVVVANDLLRRLDLAQGRLVPDGVTVAVTRNYGETATEKSDELLFTLLLASVSIAVLLSAALGWRVGILVLVVIPATILLTLFASWLMGYTINRVSLFALIFAIGILVDDAIVVVENVVRHWRRGGGGEPVALAIEAVAEIGNPTIVATLAIIAALLPMMFVSGLMGPYMSPIPANASVAMLFSYFVAVMVTPWLMVKIAWKGGRAGSEAGGRGASAGSADGAPGAFGRIYRRAAAPVLAGRLRPRLFIAAVLAATIASLTLLATRQVTVKLLPFDDKPEFQVVVDLPEGASLEATDRVLMAAARRLAPVPELTHIQVYAGTAAPFNFNGLVRHNYLRDRSWQGDLQVNLRAKGERDRQSHAIALEARRRLAGLDAPAGTSVKVVEVPPGPPVIATLLAEVYGPDPESRRAAARKVRAAFEAVDFVVDVDDSQGRPHQRLRLEIDQENLEFHGVQEDALFDTIAALLGGVGVGYSHRGAGVNPVEISVRLPNAELALSERLLATPIAAPGEAADKGAVVELGDVVRVRRERTSYPVFRRDGRFAELVTGELAGRFEAPVYGMLEVADTLREQDWTPAGPPQIRYHGQPQDEWPITVLWDGEWEITWVTFRDLGLAFAFALVGIYVLVVAHFGSFKLPLVVLSPVPLPLVGIMIGHWIFGAAFTATSMIGFIALAGIVVRNSILLVEFIQNGRRTGAGLRDVLLEAGAIRFKPIFLTAVAAMVGAAFILPDPIFQGLAISLVFGLASSTALTLLVVPCLYVWLRDDRRAAKAG